MGIGENGFRVGEILIPLGLPMGLCLCSRENVGDAPLTYYVLKHRAKKRIDPSLSSKTAHAHGVLLLHKTIRSISANKVNSTIEQSMNRIEPLTKVRIKFNNYSHWETLPTTWSFTGTLLCLMSAHKLTANHSRELSDP
jgi:hypothetical protein